MFLASSLYDHSVYRMLNKSSPSLCGGNIPDSDDGHDSSDVDSDSKSSPALKLEKRKSAAQEIASKCVNKLLMESNGRFYIDPTVSKWRNEKEYIVSQCVKMAVPFPYFTLIRHHFVIMKVEHKDGSQIGYISAQIVSTGDVTLYGYFDLKDAHKNGRSAANFLGRESDQPSVMLEKWSQCPRRFSVAEICEFIASNVDYTYNLLHNNCWTVAAILWQWLSTDLPKRQSEKLVSPSSSNHNRSQTVPTAGFGGNFAYWKQENGENHNTSLFNADSQQSSKSEPNVNVAAKWGQNFSYWKTDDDADGNGNVGNPLRSHRRTASDPLSLKPIGANFYYWKDDN